MVPIYTCKRSCLVILAMPSLMPCRSQLIMRHLPVFIVE
jgi:hypothetical protein